MNRPISILVIGGGGREHALVWTLALSRRQPIIFCAPGNPGIEEFARCVPIAADDLEGLVRFVEAEGIDLTVIGPERPLVLGLADRLRAKGHAVFGPSAAAARIEGSKSYAKAVMARANIPTASATLFDNAQRAIDHLKQQPLPLVIKADGLAQGKGVVIAHSYHEAIETVEQFMTMKRLGEAGRRLLIEQFLSGEEVTCMAVTDGQTVVPLLPSQDHKQLLDGDRGPNTGGMGAYAPVPKVNAVLMAKVEETIFRPLIAQLQAEGAPYQGLLYAGLMVCGGDPYVLEFNCRFGDPETQAVLPLLKSDLVDLCEAVAHGRLSTTRVTWHKESAACIVLTSEGYPEAAMTGRPIDGLSEASALSGVVIFHAGTATRNGRLVTHGGRVLGVTARGATLQSALAAAYQAAELVQFEGKHYRRDIGASARAERLRIKTEAFREA